MTRPKTPLPCQPSNPKSNPMVEIPEISDKQQNNLDISIAIQKGVRSCTQHSIMNHVT